MTNGPIKEMTEGESELEFERGRYWPVIHRLLAATGVLLAAFVIFHLSIKVSSVDGARISGWMVAPVVWLLFSAYGNYRKIPSETRAAEDTRNLRVAAKTIVLVFAALVLFMGIVIDVEWHNWQVRNQRVSQILAEASISLGPANAEFSTKYDEIMARQPWDFAEFQSRSNDLERLLNTNDETTKKSRMMLEKLQNDFADSPKALEMVSLTRQILDVDSKIYGYYREEIACSRSLNSKSKLEQSNFRALCIDPAETKVSSIQPEEARLLDDLQKVRSSLLSDDAGFQGER